MLLTIAAVGRLKDDAERVLVDRYVGRIGSGRSQSMGPLREVEIAESRRTSASERKGEESARLLAAAKGSDLIVMLDETGRAMTSTAFARYLGEKRDQGVRSAAFLLGGPDGHGGDVKSSAHLVFSLGPMTLPHGLARAVLAEQLYRATTILGGHPYHRS